MTARRLPPGAITVSLMPAHWAALIDLIDHERITDPAALADATEALANQLATHAALTLKDTQ